MANIKISQLTSAATLTGAEEVPVVQGSSTVKTTAQDIANLAGGGGSSTLDVVTVGTLGTSSLTFNYTSVVTISPASGTQSAPVLSYPSIAINGGMGFTGTVSSISFPTLATTTISIGNIPTLTTVDLPVLTKVVYSMQGILNFSYCPSLTTINIPSLVSMPDNSYLQFQENALSQATVDNVLVRMVATGALNGNIQLGGGTSSAPSAIGLAAKATLEGRGWSVTTN